MNNLNYSFTYYLDSMQREDYGMHKWYPLLREFTFTSTEYLLIPDEISDVLDNTCSRELLEFVDSVINKYDGKVFPRLHLVSPKYFKPCTTAKQVFRILRSTPRTQEVLRDCLRRNVDCPLFLREWHDFSDLTEIRCFISNGKLTAFCQNDAQKDSEPLENPLEMKQRVIDFVDRLLPSCPYRDCTLDLALSQDTIHLVEVNTPYTMLAGTGLFEYPAEAPLLKQGTLNGPLFRYYTSLFYDVGEV